MAIWDLEGRSFLAGFFLLGFTLAEDEEEDEDDEDDEDEDEDDDDEEAT